MISFRMFVRDEEAPPTILVLANGKWLKDIEGNDTVSATSDEYSKFYYDVSEFADKSVNIEIANTNGPHACFNRICLAYTVKDASLYPNEQYNKATFDNATAVAERSWMGVSLATWHGNCGTKEHDQVEWLPSGQILLEGSDMGDSADYMPNSWIYNKFDLTEYDKYLHLTFVCGENADTSFRVRLLWVENDVLYSCALSNTNDIEIDEYGYAVVSTQTFITLSFDLTEHKGKSVLLSIEQDDNGDGSGEQIYLKKILIDGTVQ